MTRKLLIVTPDVSQSGGGIATLARLLIDSMVIYCQEHALELNVWCLEHKSDYAAKVPIRYFNGSQRQLALALWFASIKRPQPRIVATHMGPMRALGILPRWLRPAYLLFLLGIEVWRDFNSTQRFSLNGAYQLLAISNYTRQRAYQHHTWLNDVEVLHLALEKRIISEQPNENILSQVGTDFVLIVGRLDASQQHKGHDDLIEAFISVLLQIPSAKLVVTGKGDDADRLKAKANKLGILQSVIFTGFVDASTLDYLFQRCRVFAMPSIGDGFGFVYLEAMRHHKPCIALQVSSGAEIIVDGETGLLVKHGDYEGLASAISRFLEDEEFARKCGFQGYLRFQAHFTQEVFAENLSKYLNDLMLNPRFK